MKQFRTLTLALFAVSSLSLASCAHHGAALIDSDPPGAEVVDLDSDTLVGVTPVKVWWKESGDERKFVNIRLQKSGFRDKTTSFWVTLRHGSRDSAVNNPQDVKVILDKN